jgi:hypothetical protein
MDSRGHPICRYFRVLVGQTPLHLGDHDVLCNPGHTNQGEAQRVGTQLCLVEFEYFADPNADTHMVCSAVAWTTSQLQVPVSNVFYAARWCSAWGRPSK